MADDTKEIQMAGCSVRLAYQQIADGTWTVVGIIRCGVGENVKEQSVRTEPFTTREAAEQDALNRVGQLLGNNVDRSSSRVKNHE